MRIFPAAMALLTLAVCSVGAFCSAAHAATPPTSVCRGKPTAVMDAASESLVKQISGRALKVPEIGGCDSFQTGSILGFDHAGSTLYLVQATCMRKTGPKTFINAVMECDDARSRFSILGISWGGSKGHGVAGGPAIAGNR